MTDRSLNASVASSVGTDRFKWLQDNPTALAKRISAAGGRWLVWGPPGVGKSTLVSSIASHLERAGVQCWELAADPGSPSFGVPGALALGRWMQGAWRLEQLAPLCTLDAVRYRLPLVLALRRLCVRVGPHLLLVDAPGVVRGLAAAELLAGILEAADADRIIAVLPLSGAETDSALATLGTLSSQVVITTPSPLAHPDSKKQRARARTDQWDRWLGAGVEETLHLGRFRLIGALDRDNMDWQGRQIALLDKGGDACAMGEGIALEGDRLLVRMRRIRDTTPNCRALLVRDAARGPEGLLRTAKDTGTRSVGRPVALPPDLTAPEGGSADPACFVHLGVVSALLVNGLFGDPLLHLRLRQRRRSLLFDLGDSGRLPAKIAHQVTDIFVTHAHMDHIGGFLWFLRSRIKEPALCRLYGPPGLAGHIASFIGGIRWDRIGASGPRFEIHELRGGVVFRRRIQVGGRVEDLGRRSVTDGILLQEPGFRVRAVLLDHGIPVLAFAFEADPVVHIRKDRLGALTWAPGPWIGDLKRQLSAGKGESMIRLPNGERAPVSALATELVEYEPARRLVYATDLADTAGNRANLSALARGADAFICEAAFSDADVQQATRTAHLTARTCAQIAAEAQVKRLMPFHFSRRYESDPGVIYAELKDALGRARIQVLNSSQGSW